MTVIFVVLAGLALVWLAAAAIRYRRMVDFRLHVRDTDCDFRLFRRRLVTDVPLVSTSGVVCVEMMYRFERAGARFVETPVHHYFRPHGRSQFFRLPAIASSARQLLSLWWRLVVRGR